MRRALLWDSALGFVGFFAFLALIQAGFNLFQPSPALWPGLFAGILIALEWALWRAKRKDLQ